MSKVFISWGGDKAEKYACELEKILKNVFEQESEIYCSVSNESGVQWLNRINKALEECEIGIIILTRESLNRPWVNFEAGAIYKADDEKRIISIFVDIDFKDLENHPLRFFQSRYKFEIKDVQALLGELSKKLHWGYSALAMESVEKELEFFLTQNKESDIVEAFLNENHINIHRDGGYMAEIKYKDFWELRKKIIEDAQGELVIAGQSLEDAFAEDNQHTIVRVLREKILSGGLTSIRVLLTDPALFSGIQNFDIGTNNPLGRLSVTMDTLIKVIFPCCEQKKCEISIYFIPLLEIDHAVISHRYMGFRSTKLWTRKGEFKGSFALYRKTEDECSEYSAHLDYLNKLMETSTYIDLDIDIYDSPDDGITMRSHKAWRKAVKERGFTVVRLHKLYHAQIVNYVADDWKNEPDIMSVFKPSKRIAKYEDLFKAKNLLNDETQKVLLPYILKTKNLFESAIRKYDSYKVRVGEEEFYRSGVMVFPSLDLGFPNNIQRLAGGFATGMFITWKCGIPIVPVDATVNVCSSSVFELNDFDTSLSNEEFIKYIEDLMFKATKGKGYSFSFDSGNHFLMIAQDPKSKRLYLVLHSSAKEFKESYMGLYPVENNWYSNSTRTYPSPYAPERYIRYIKDNEAKYFIENAHKLEKYNVQIHKWFADEMGGDRNKQHDHTYHHYYMPTDNSIAMGTYAEEPGTIVPVFSNIGQDIYMFRIGRDNWKIHLKGKDLCLVPHGWGQVIDGVKSINVDNDNHILTIDETEYEIKSKARIMNEGRKHIRNFKDGEEFFERGKQMIQGEIVQTLRPIYLYCSRKKGKVNEAIR